jgi:choline dehydrogenase-like flavoprotein
VVDTHGCVHGMESLYVVDGSVLPRSSRVNPSLTIYSWSLRVAQALSMELRERQAMTMREAIAS